MYANRPGREDVDVLVVEGERPGLDGVGDVAVEHAHAADARTVGDTHAALRVVGRRGHLSRAPSPWRRICMISIKAVKSSWLQVKDYVSLSLFLKFLHLAQLICHFCLILTGPCRIGQIVEQPKQSQ